MTSAAYWWKVMWCFWKIWLKGKFRWRKEKEQVQTLVENQLEKAKWAKKFYLLWWIENGLWVMNLANWNNKKISMKTKIEKKKKQWTILINFSLYIRQFTFNRIHSYIYMPGYNLRSQNSNWTNNFCTRFEPPIKSYICFEKCYT